MTTTGLFAPGSMPWAAKVLVVDTNFLARMAWWAADHPGDLTDLEKALDGGRVFAFAGPQLPEEMERRLPDVRPRRDPFCALETWRTRLAPRVRLVDLPVGLHLDPSVGHVLRTDPDDIPTAALARFLAPAAVLSYDRVFADAGMPLPADPRLAVRAVVAACEQEDMAYVGMIGVYGAGAAAWRGAARATSLARRDPAGALLLVAALGLLLLVTEDVRPGTARTVRGRVGLGLRTIGALALDAAGQVMTAHREAAGRIVEVPRHAGHTLEEAAAAVLARHGAPMSVADLRAVLADPPPGYGRPTAHEVSRSLLTRSLRGHEAFTHDHRGWSLGRLHTPTSLLVAGTAVDPQPTG